MSSFSRGRSGGLVFPSLEEFSPVDCDPHSQRLGIFNKAEVEYIMKNPGLDEAQAGIKIAGINNLRYADDNQIISDLQMTPLLWQKMKRN